MKVVLLLFLVCDVFLNVQCAKPSKENVENYLRNLAAFHQNKRTDKSLTRNTNDDLAFTVIPKHQITRALSSVKFECKAKGNPTPHKTWFFNGKRLLLSDRLTIFRDGTLVIREVHSSDHGIYSCQAENILKRIAASANLTVLSEPGFVQTPVNTTVNKNERVNLYCKALGVPKPIITWSKNNQLLINDENILISDEGDVLSVLNASKKDVGDYKCKAENLEGSVEATGTLQVNENVSGPPKIVSRPYDTHSLKETTIQLTCEVESNSKATIQWKKDGSRLSNVNRTLITAIGSLVINNLTLLDTGRYECLAINKYGHDSASAFLTVTDPLRPGDRFVNKALTEAITDIDKAINITMEHLFNHDSSNANLHDFFRISRYPNAPAREMAKAAEVYERTLDKVKKLIQSGIVVNSTDPFNYQNVLSTQHLDLIARLSGCTAHREIRDCSDICFHRKFRNIDGSCNNFAHPTWGSSLTGFRRILPPIYENGFSQPLGWNQDKKYNGFTLPSARLVSTTLITTEEISEDIEYSHMAMQWGQWLDHDLDHGLPSVSSQTWDGVDCKKTCEYAAPCFPIDVPAGDPRINNRRCIDFVRTSSVCGSGMTSVLFGTLQAREQINQLTSFIDASQVYGFQYDVAQDLRELTNDNGLLRVGAIFPKKKPLLPTIGINGMDCRRDLNESTRLCFVAGDIRANEQIGLAAMHTIWMREHNRIATELKKVNPFWDGDRLYQEARKIVGAEIQYITYEDWLPIILGPDGYQKLGDYRGYNRKINPSISNVFATAALRFGHSMINPILYRYDENFDPIPQGHLLLRHAFFSPWRLTDEGGVDPLMRGMFLTPAKLKTSTQNLNSELTERLFETAHAVALDLAAINIQRGRDHGLPSYTKFREFCNMSTVKTFDDLAGEISDGNVRKKLEELYGSPHNIDVWVGGILEDQVKGGKVGPLFRCILVEQFQRLRDGDRLWFENHMTFKPEQLEQIKETSLARILCDNGDNIDTISENVFILPESQGGFVACEDVPGIDFTYWADCESCSDCEDSIEYKESGRTKRSISPETNDLKICQNALNEANEELKKRIENLEEIYKTLLK